jgi:ubiquinol-cytochrome c reductase cytochrome c subunit
MPAELRALAATLAVALVAATPAAATAPARGKQLYGKYCVSCHGLAGVTRIGQGAVAPSLRGVGALAADFYLRTGYMPLQRLGLQPRRSRVLFDERQLRALTAYVASLGPGPPIPHPHPERGNLSRGQALFADHCAGCHQIAGEGGYVTGAVPPPLEEATATQIAEAVRIGPNVMPRFSTKAIPDDALDSIIRYVEYAKHPDDRGGWALGHLGPVPEGLVTFFIGAAALVFTCMVIGKRYRHE